MFFFLIRYSLVEIQLNSSGQYDSRFIASHENPLMIKATWTRPGKFLLCQCAVGDSKILQAINGFLKMVRVGSSMGPQPGTDLRDIFNALRISLHVGKAVGD